MDINNGRLCIGQLVSGTSKFSKIKQQIIPLSLFFVNKLFILARTSDNPKSENDIPIV